MSISSDNFEKQIAESINGTVGIKATRSTKGTAYSDVLLEINGKKIWLEVKMNHTDNLSNPRIFYKDGKWQTTYKTPAAQESIRLMNSSPTAKKFIKDIAVFSGIDEKKIEIPTTKTGLKSMYAVPLDIMKKYFDQPSVNRYLHSEPNYKISDIVTKHYRDKAGGGAYYLQADDDFYMIGKDNPLKLSKNIPELEGSGDFKVRVSTRSAYYEVQAEIKIKKLKDSKYSVKKGTSKKNPFTTK